jgi:hypothetical protein
MVLGFTLSFSLYQEGLEVVEQLSENQPFEGLLEEQRSYCKLYLI